MPLLINHIYKISGAVLCGLICCSLMTSACNSSSHRDKNGKDTIPAIDLPAQGPLAVSDSIRISNAARLWYDTVLKLKGFNGGMIVAQNGNIIFEQYKGTVHLPGTDSINQHTPLHIASISKTFTAMAVLKLQQDSLLHIDDAFSKYFPTFNYPGITIRSLLCHRSGLPNYNYFMEKLGWDKKKYVSNQDVFNYLVTKKAQFTDIKAPNQHFTYCNTNYALLALLIEKVAGTSYAGYISQQFFKPLGMNDTYVFTLADTATAAPSYNWKGSMESFTFLDQVYGDKNIYTTPRDLLTWDRALSSNLIFTNETLEQAYAPYSNEKPGMRNYGLGWRMSIFPDGNKIIYHNGWWHGSNASFTRLLKEKASIIIIGNKYNRSVYHARVLTSLFGNYYGAADEEEAAAVVTDTLKTTTPAKIKAAPKKPVKKAKKKTISKRN